MDVRLSSDCAICPSKACEAARMQAPANCAQRGSLLSPWWAHTAQGPPLARKPFSAHFQDVSEGIAVRAHPCRCLRACPQASQYGGTPRACPGPICRTQPCRAPTGPSATESCGSLWECMCTSWARVSRGSPGTQTSAGLNPPVRVVAVRPILCSLARTLPADIIPDPIILAHDMQKAFEKLDLFEGAPRIPQVRAERRTTAFSSLFSYHLCTLQPPFALSITGLAIVPMLPPISASSTRQSLRGH